MAILREVSTKDGHKYERKSYIVRLTTFKIESVLKLTFIVSCIANIFSECNQQDATFHNLFTSVRRSTCFRRFFRPSSGVQNCTYSVRHLSDRYCYLMLAAGNSNGRKSRLKHVERLTEVNKFEKSCILLVGL